MDIGFLIDSSASMSKSYSRELQFVEALSGEYKISESGNHATTVIYSNDAQINIPLSQGTRQQQFNDQLRKTPFLGSDTRFERGLAVVKQVRERLIWKIGRLVLIIPFVL